MKKWWSTLTVLTLVALLFHFDRLISSNTTSIQDSLPRPETLAEKARELKEKGIFAAPPKIVQVAYPPIRDYEELLSQSKLAVVATCTDFVYRLNQDGSDIETLFKFQITDALHGKWKSPPAGRGVPRGARSFGPLGRNELIVIQAGGILRVDDVLFSATYSGLPGFESGKEYVLFLKALKPEPTQVSFYGGADLEFYYPTAGPKGCYQFDAATSTIRSVNDRGADLDRLLEVQFGRNKDLFVEHIRALSKRINSERGGQ